MKIQRATFIGVRGVPDLTLDLTDARTGAPRGLVVVTGPSGSGKTRMLEALIAAKEAIRPYGAMAAGAPWIGAGSAAKIRVAFHLDEAEREFAGTASHILEGEVIFYPDRANGEADDGLRALLGRYSHNPAYGKVDYFPAERRIPMFPPFPGVGSAEQRVARLGKDQRKYGFILPFLRTLDHDGARRERFAAGLAALSPSCRYVADPSGEVIPRCFSSYGGAPVTVAQLSHGESDAVIFAATAAAIGLEHSLIFVDRPDLHADDLSRLVTGLTSLGQDNQLFLTGRPELAAAAPGAHVVNLKGA
jgi:predicted ATPase